MIKLPEILAPGSFGLGKGVTLLRAATFMEPVALVEIANRNINPKGIISFPPPEVRSIANEVFKRPDRKLADYLEAWRASPGCREWAERVRAFSASELVDTLATKAKPSR